MGGSERLRTRHAVCPTLLALQLVLPRHPPWPPLIKGGKLCWKHGATKRAATGRRIPTAGADFSTPQGRGGGRGATNCLAFVAMVCWSRRNQLQGVQGVVERHACCPRHASPPPLAPP